MTPADMINHLEQGYTMREIGEMCGRNRNSVAGLISRYRKANDLPTHTEQAAKEARQKGYNTLRTFQRCVLPQAKPEGFHAVLERNGCRYIEGDIRIKPVYCEGDATHGAYCEEHAKRCYVGKAG